MRIRKRQVPLPFSSLSPLPLSDPFIRRSSAVQLPQTTKPFVPKSPHPPYTATSGPVPPSDQTNRLSPVIGSGNNGCDSSDDASGAHKKENNLKCWLTDMEDDGEEDGKMGDNTSNRGFPSAATVNGFFLKSAPSSPEFRKRYGGERDFPPKKRRVNMEKRETEQSSSTKMKTKMNKKCDGEESSKACMKSSSSSKKRARGREIMEGSRCSRVNGRGWRCCQQTLVGYSLCEHHLGKGRLRSMTSVRSRSAVTAAPDLQKKEAKRLEKEEEEEEDDDDDDDDSDDENYEHDENDTEWVAVLDDEDEEDDSEEALGDWAKLETMRSSHPLYFAKKLSDVASDDPIDWMEQPPASLAIQGVLRPAFSEEHSVIQKHLLSRQSNNADPIEIQKSEENNTKHVRKINGDGHESSSDSSVWSEKSDEDIPVNETSFYKLEMIKVQLFSGNGHRSVVEVEDYTKAQPDAIAHSAAKIISRLKAGGEKTTQALKSLCCRCKGIQVEEVMIIGVDSLGFDLRICSGTQIQTLRFTFNTRATSEYSAERLLNDLLFPRIHPKQQKIKQAHQNEF